uniref:Uncharacterized protein n=1 Tax=Anguilla anguilla TaxID=7936 RepID=A0A0E9R3R6_ANGAN
MCTAVELCNVIGR